MQNSQDVTVTELSLPKGGGTIKGMKGDLNPAGPDGRASLSLPLPISDGRGVAPSLSLTYTSSTGNGPFGMGWQCEPSSIRLRTSHGVPFYNHRDTFLGPTGEVMTIVPNTMGQAERRTSNTLQGTLLSESYSVTHYQSRIIYDFSRLEYWQPVLENSVENPFWVMYSPDGQLHIFGKHAHARVANPRNEKQIAEWLLEETVTPTGEHIYYQYRSEDEVGCDLNEKQQHPDVTARRYLVQVNFGNITPQASLFALDTALPDKSQWLFHLVFDYGERALSMYEVPNFQPNMESWGIRPDCFSRFEYGFEIRTRRLCRQVLMFHRLQALAGEENKEEVPSLVSRLILSYDLNSNLSLLVTARLLAHEEDGTPVTMPPLELDYLRFDTTHIPEWQAMPQLAGLNGQQPYQLVDLYGEGLPGVLYQNLPGAWWYRSPMRGENDEVIYSSMKPLPQIPSQQNAVMLMDINADGRLDWVVATSGIRGYHSMEGGQWTKFIPISALPIEYFHPQAQLADLLGDGLVDLVLIGPRSVRLYANHQDGWGKGVNVIQSGDITLPIPGADARKLVAFADMLGSGQVHLVEISAKEVRCWPNLGHGRFGPPLLLTGFGPSGETFNPSQLFLADMDGSGTVDIVYAHSNFLEIFLNESGNHFRAPIRIDFPPGVRFDRTCLLQVADTQGLGISSLILTIPHKSPHHWRLDLAQHKPWLLNVINNNLGAETTLFYRSSAQFWLDEKQRAQDKGQLLTSYLPFPMHLLWRTERRDEITGNQLITLQSYAHGAWDGKGREFRGFGQVTQVDIDAFSQTTRGVEIPMPPPTRLVSWFATGMAEVDAQLPVEFWQKDEHSFPPFSVRFTYYDHDAENDVTFIPKDEESYWLNRALKGQLLHSELYGDDASDRAAIPYTVNDYRLQVRMLAGLKEKELFAWTSVIETRSYQYERILSDPRCSQQLLLRSDYYGFPMETLDIAYPRRPKPSISPYPDTLPETLFASSYDEQQHLLRLTRQRQTYYHITEKDRLFLGLADVTRTDAWEYPASEVPQHGLSLEVLSAENSLLTLSASQTFLGYKRLAYTGPDEAPNEQALIAYTEKTVFDEQNLLAFSGVLSTEDLQEKLIEAGYVLASRPFSESREPDIWVARQGYTDYGGAKEFYRPLAQRDTVLTGKNLLSWDRHYCVVIQTQDAAGLTTRGIYDYRFLVPLRIIDINDNQSEVTLTALGQVSSSRFWGWENNQMNGYTPPEEKPFTPPTSVTEALALKSGIPVANCLVYALLSWMPNAEMLNQKEYDEVQWQALQQSGVITEDKKICALAYHRWLKSQEGMHGKNIQLAHRVPPHILALATDRYDQDSAQQIAQIITFSDGFGRELQNVLRHEAGEAWQRADDGSLITGNDGRPLVVHTETRWAVSGRIEYDGKGQIVRAYQPFFLNDWHYVSNDSARKDLYADTYSYDALGREFRVKTAKGYLREGLFTPWFAVNEDENDTASRMNS